MEAIGSYANTGFFPANPELLALGRGWASRTGANELAPWAGLRGRGQVLLNHMPRGFAAQAGSKASMSLQRIVRVSLEHPTSAVCVAGVETLVDIYG